MMAYFQHRLIILQITDITSFKTWQNCIEIIAILRLQDYSYVGFGLRLTHYALSPELTSSHRRREKNLTQFIFYTTFV